MTATRLRAEGRTADASQHRGERIGRYVVVDTIGAGAMGTVHAAYDPELARTVALKVVRPQAAARLGAHGMRMRLLREAQAMARVVHPNVVPIFDVGEHGDRLYLAMERIDGVNLRRWLARGKPSVRALLDVLVPAGRGLAAAHHEGLVHRDFKPENVLVGAGRVCVTDFGLARPSVEPHASASMSGVLGVTFTAEGERVGTPAYMAPEQYRGEPVDARSDLYAFCVVLYEGLYGRRPDERDAARAPLAVPSWLQRILARGLADDPSLRFPSMDALLAEIERQEQRRRACLRTAGAVTLSLAAIGLGLATQPGARTHEARVLVHPIVDTIRDRPAALAEELLALARLEHEAGDVAAATAIADEALRVARLARRPAVEAEAWMTLARFAEGDAAHVRFCARMAIAANEAASSSTR